MKQVIELILAAITIAMEAGNQSRRGKLAVAFVIANRAKRDNKSWSDVILKSMQFSAWNTESNTRMNIDQIPAELWAECLTVALAAMFNLELDPTFGAYFYLNKQTVIAQAGQLPSWWDIDGDPATEVQIDEHSFRGHR